MRNGLKVLEPIIKVNEGNISYDFTKLKEQALQVAEMVSKTIVTEDNVKESKTILATVNKAVKKLEDERILVKKQLLAPYLKLESDVKEIVGIISEANEVVKVQVQELDHLGRLEKEQQLKDIWNKRVKHYDIKDIFTFTDFLKPNHLNKSLSINKIEEEMTSFLESTENDVQAILSLENSEGILSVYKDTKNLGESLKIVSERNKKGTGSKRFVSEKKHTETFKIEIEGLQNRSLVEQFLKDNKITYKLI